ncbi:MAG: AAA family ATPase [Gammaproteobacteria bacterium]|nr:AAA family ATPase [Gammaproteobacteria bacterium]MBU1724062.1 AAA family ATPase [Gammaproteobacteria bacterium]MBU2006869.1 AAA family ATPase [Gammaproteobacteria bacterium]
MNESILKGYLDHVEIRGFRSLKDVSVELSPLTVLIGANGAGKSNFIKFFEMMRWLMDGRSLREWVLRESGADDNLFMGKDTTDSVTCQLSLTIEGQQDRYEYQSKLLADTSDQMSIVYEHTRLSDEKWMMLPSASTDVSSVFYQGIRKPVLADGKLLKSGIPQVLGYFLQRCRVYQFHDTARNAGIKKHHDTSDSVFLNSDGDNLAAILLALRENHAKRFKLIEKQISRVLSSFDGFVLEPQHGKVMLRWRHKQGDKIMGAHLTSDGSLRLFCLITLLNLPVEQLPDIILLDEPELGLHPNAITLIAAMIQRVSHTSQVILATQSPFMVDCFELDNIVVADLEEGATRLRKLAKETYQQWLDDEFSVSELWLSNVLGGQV